MRNWVNVEHIYLNFLSKVRNIVLPNFSSAVPFMLGVNMANDGTASISRRFAPGECAGETE